MLVESSLSNTASLPDELRKLLDSVLEQEKKCTSQFLCLLVELLKNRSLDLSAYSLALSEVEENNQVVFKVSSLNDEVLFLWEGCLALAILNLDLADTSLTTAYHSVCAFLNSEDLESFLIFINPLMQRTSFEIMMGPGHIIVPPPQKEMEQLYYHAFYMKKDEYFEIINLIEDLKNNGNNRFENCIFTVSGEIERNEIVLSIACNTLEEMTVWKSGIFSALAKVKYDIVSIKIDYDIILHVTITAECAEYVLNYLKPLIEISIFEELHFDKVQPEIIDRCSELFRGESIGNLKLTPGYSPEEDLLVFPITSWLNFVRALKISKVDYERVVILGDIDEFLIPLADIVESIYIREVNIREGVINPIPPSVIRDILSRKCKYLQFSESAISIAEAEKIIKLLHHSDKKGALRMPISSPQEYFKIGEYAVKSEIISSKHLFEIEHIEMEPKISEMFSWNTYY